MRWWVTVAVAALLLGAEATRVGSRRLMATIRARRSRRLSGEGRDLSCSLRPVVTPRTVVAMQYGGGQQQGYGGQIDGQIAAEPPAERQFDGYPVASPATLLHPHTDFAQRYWTTLLKAGDTVIDATVGNGHDAVTDHHSNLGHPICRSADPVFTSCSVRPSSPRPSAVREAARCFASMRRPG